MPPIRLITGDFEGHYDLLVDAIFYTFKLSKDDILALKEDIDDLLKDIEAKENS